jgi:hypothetical protein
VVVGDFFRSPVLPGRFGVLMGFVTNDRSDAAEYESIIGASLFGNYDDDDNTEVGLKLLFI